MLSRVGGVAGVSARPSPVLLQIAPSSLLALSEAFHIPHTVSPLPLLASAAIRADLCTHALGTSLGGDLAALESAAELGQRLSARGSSPLPLFTSCCSAWTAAARRQFPDLSRRHLSTCLSPMAMLAAVLSSRHPGCHQIAVMPCAAKKREVSRVAEVWTTAEFVERLRKRGVTDLAPGGQGDEAAVEEGSASSKMFGFSGGVAEATVQNLEGKYRPGEWPEILWRDGEAEVGGVRVAVVQSVAAGLAMLGRIQRGEKVGYHLVEVMSCSGGCSGHGKQGRGTKERVASTALRERRLLAGCRVRTAHDNPYVQGIYREVVRGAPFSEQAKRLLHDI